MAQEPCRSVPRVFWIMTMDNESGHRGQKAIDRLQRQWPTLIPVFTPTHASWLNQIEIYFSIVQARCSWGHGTGTGASWVSSPRGGTRRCAFGPYARPALRPGRFGWGARGFATRGGLPEPRAAGLVQLSR